MKSLVIAAPGELQNTIDAALSAAGAGEAKQARTIASAQESLEGAGFVLLVSGRCTDAQMLFLKSLGERGIASALLTTRAEAPRAERQLLTARCVVLCAPLSSKELAIAVNNIGEGIRKAVQTSMEDERMKTDLITNVSHDIKTPLTSIINYVDLLKRLKIDEEPAKGYIDILDGKAQRLKQLTDDLVEASKISSGSIVLENAKLNLTELFNQGIGEFSEKLEEGRLQVVFEGDDTPAYVFADSRRMWRVVENLFNNICKYAMEGTRVYIEMKNREGFITVSVKNISRQQMSIRPE